MPVQQGRDLIARRAQDGIRMIDHPARQAGRSALKFSRTFALFSASVIMFTITG